VVGHDEHEHGGREQLQNGEEPVVPGLTLHVADGEDVHHEGDRGDHSEHDDRRRIDVDAHAEMEVADLAPADVVGPGTKAAAVREEIGGDDQHQHERRADRQPPEIVALPWQIASHESEHEEHARRDRSEHPGVFGNHLVLKVPFYHLRMAASSTLLVARLRNRRMTIASARATSAAATVMTNTAKMAPVMREGSRYAAKATKFRLTAFSMSSTLMRIITAFLRESTPTTPRLKMIALRTR